VCHHRKDQQRLTRSAAFLFLPRFINKTSPSYTEHEGGFFYECIAFPFLFRHLCPKRKTDAGGKGNQRLSSPDAPFAFTDWVRVLSEDQKK
jgi:hypothetical protein